MHASSSRNTFVHAARAAGSHVFSGNCTFANSTSNDGSKDFDRCRPWKAKRRPVVPGRRRRGRLAGVAEGRSPAAAEARCKRIRSAVKPFDGGPWRSPTAPLGARRDGAVARSGANRGPRVVAARKAKGGLGRPVSHPEHGDTPIGHYSLLVITDREHDKYRTHSAIHILHCCCWTYSFAIKV